MQDPNIYQAERLVEVDLLAEYAVPDAITSAVRASLVDVKAKADEEERQVEWSSLVIDIAAEPVPAGEPTPFLYVSTHVLGVKRG